MEGKKECLFTKYEKDENQEDIWYKGGLNGSTWGGSMLLMGRVSYGMHTEFWREEHACVWICTPTERWEAYNPAGELIQSSSDGVEGDTKPDPNPPIDTDLDN